MGSKARLIIIWLTVISLFTGTWVVLVHAQANADYDLSWFSVNSGGGISAGGDYCVGGSVGQAEAGALSGEGYDLVGGFWSGTGPVSAPSQYTVYLPCLLRGLAAASQ